MIDVGHEGQPIDVPGLEIHLMDVVLSSAAIETLPIFEPIDAMPFEREISIALRMQVVSFSPGTVFFQNKMQGCPTIPGIPATSDQATPAPPVAP